MWVLRLQVDWGNKEAEQTRQRKSRLTTQPAGNAVPTTVCASSSTGADIHNCSKLYFILFIETFRSSDGYTINSSYTSRITLSTHDVIQ